MEEFVAVDTKGDITIIACHQLYWSLLVGQSMKLAFRISWTWNWRYITYAFDRYGQPLTKKHYRGWFGQKSCSLFSIQCWESIVDLLDTKGRERTRIKPTSLLIQISRRLSNQLHTSFSLSLIATSTSIIELTTTTSSVSDLWPVFDLFSYGLHCQQNLYHNYKFQQSKDLKKIINFSLHCVTVDLMQQTQPFDILHNCKEEMNKVQYHKSKIANQSFAAGLFSSTATFTIFQTLSKFVSLTSCCCTHYVIPLQFNLIDPCIFTCFVHSQTLQANKPNIFEVSLNK